MIRRVAGSTTRPLPALTWQQHRRREQWREAVGDVVFVVGFMLGIVGWATALTADPVSFVTAVMLCSVATASGVHLVYRAITNRLWPLPRRLVVYWNVPAAMLRESTLTLYAKDRDKWDSTARLAVTAGARVEVLP